MAATLLAVAAKKRSWERTCSCEVPTWSLEWWCPPSGWPCPGPGPCCSPHRSRRRPGGCNNFFCNMGGWSNLVYIMDIMGNMEERSECTIRLMASWQDDRWLSEKPGARRGRDSYTNVVALSPSSPTLHRKQTANQHWKLFSSSSWSSFSHHRLSLSYLISLPADPNVHNSRISLILSTWDLMTVCFNPVIFV